MTAAVTRTAAASLVDASVTSAKASRTGMTETFGKASVTRSNTAVSASIDVFTVAIWVCGARSSTPGANMKVKFCCSPPQSTSRVAASSAVMFRPSTLSVTVSPIAMPKPAAMPSVMETIGGPS